MNNLIKTADNKPETLNKQFFSQFMKKVSVRNYANISKENYLSDMKARSGGKF